MAPQDAVLYKGEIARHFVFVHIPKSGGSAFLEESSRHMPVGYSIRGNGERSMYKTSGSRQDMVTLLREPTHHVVSQFMMCKYSEWGRSKTAAYRNFPGQWTTDNSTNNTNHFAGLDEWVQHFVRQEHEASNETLGGDKAFSCYNPWNMQTRHFAVPEKMRNPLAANRIPPIDVAKKNLDEIGFVGIAEHFDASMCLFEFHTLGYLTQNCQCHEETKQLGRQNNGVKIVHDVPRYNVTESLSSDARLLIQKLVQVDNVLYEYAMERFKNDLRHVADVTGVDLSCGRLSLQDNVVVAERFHEESNCESPALVFPLIQWIATAIMILFIGARLFCRRKLRRRR